MQFKDIPVGERFNFANAVAGITDSGRLTKSGVNQATDPHGLPVLMDDNTIESAVKNVGTVFDDGRELQLCHDLSLIWLRNGGPIYDAISITDLIKSGLGNSHGISKLLVINGDSEVSLGRPIKRVSEDTLEAIFDTGSFTAPSTIKIVNGEPRLLGERLPGDAGCRQGEAVHMLKRLGKYSELEVARFLEDETAYATAITLKEHELNYVKSIAEQKNANENDLSLPHQKRAADEALLMLGLDIISDNDIESWNANRNNGGEPNPEVSLHDWVEHAGYLSKEFYVTDPSGEAHGIYRKAFYGEWEGLTGFSVIVEDYDGKEILLPEGNTPGAV